MKRWIPLLILAAAQFIMVLDTTVMNVSITQVVKDLDTTVKGMQTAITAYTLVMAAFMLTGAKLGDIIGRRQTFAVGLLIYGTGSLITALSANMTMLYLGWSVTEGIGAVLVIPAIAALVVSTYQGADRALAYGALGGIAAAGAALGPLIGGWATTYLSWRYVFLAETVLVVVLLLFRKQLAAPPRPERVPRLDGVGTVLSAAGLGLIVFAVLQSGTWGWVSPKGALTIAGTEITPFGVSVVPFMIAAGCGVLMLFEWWEQRQISKGKDALIDLSLLKIPQLRVGLATMLSMQMIIMGLFFILPVFLQTVIGLDAFDTGVRLLPLSIAMFLAALAGPKLSTKWPARRIVWVGLAAMLCGTLIMAGVVDLELQSGAFAVALALFGIGAGLLASQLGNIIMSSTETSRSSEVGGLQGTAQNLGASFGTALIGAVLISSLTAGALSGIADSPNVTPKVQQAIQQQSRAGIPIVSVSDVNAGLAKAGLSGEEANDISNAYEAAQVTGLKQALLAVAALTLVGFAMSRKLPAS